MKEKRACKVPTVYHANRELGRSVSKAPSYKRVRKTKIRTQLYGAVPSHSERSRAIRNDLAPTDKLI